MELPEIGEDPSVLECIRNALLEDLRGGRDVTTLSLVGDSEQVRAVILSKEETVISGVDVARSVFHSVDERISCETCIPDGACSTTGDTVLRICGPARGILTAERTALNFMQRMCGIASLTRLFVDRVTGYNVDILDTRKTTPGLRALEKYAVRCGGGKNHRMGLYDRILIKDNHRKLWKDGDSDRLDLAVGAARKAFGGIPVEVEVETMAELESVLAALPEWILLDNMDCSQLEECVRLCRGRCLLEASGGITMDNVESIARTGIDAISLGCLTHSAPSADLSLELLD